MNKKILIVISIIVLIIAFNVLGGLFRTSYDIPSQDYKFSQGQLRKYQSIVTNYAQSNELDWIGCGVTGAKVELELREHADVDYEQLKEDIYIKAGVKFPLKLVLIPFPEKPSIQGHIRLIEKKNDEIRLLIVNDEKFIVDDTPDAIDVTITDETVLEDIYGNEIEIDNIKTGMYASSYYRGMTLTTYPGQEGSEKLVVDLYANFEPHDDAKNHLSQAKFGDNNVSKAYMVIGDSFNKSILRDGFEFTMTIYEGQVYYDLEERSVYGYEGKIYIYLHKNHKYILNPGIMTETFLPADYELIFEDLDKDGHYEFFIPYYKANTIINQCYSIIDGQIVRKEEYDVVKD